MGASEALDLQGFLKLSEECGDEGEQRAIWVGCIRTGILAVLCQF